MSEQSVLASVRNGVGHLTLNRPAGLNALTIEMIRQIREHLGNWLKDDQVRVIAIRAAGDRAFCAGGDIRSLYNSYKADDGIHLQFFEEEYSLDLMMHSYPKPILALMDGLVLGGGMGLAQAASNRVITERTRMAMPETGIGYFPDVGGSYFLSRLEGSIGEYLGITGTQIGAADALYCNLADYCISSETLSELDHSLNQHDWTDNPQADLDCLLHLRSSQKIPGSEIKALRSAIDFHFGHSDMTQIKASLAAESCPAFQDWAETTLTTMQSKSPLAMCVTLELLRRGRELELSECFALELHLDRQWFSDGDIMEGVRALIVDKDKKPHWRVPDIEGVTSENVSRFFQGFNPSHTARHIA